MTIFRRYGSMAWLWLSVTACPLLAATPSEPDLATLKKAAEPWLASQDDIAVRHNATALYQLIDALVARRDEAGALPYLERVLRADPRSFDYQLTHGEILSRQGSPDALTTRVEQAIQLAENDATLRRAYRLGRREPPATPPLLADLAAEPGQLVLVSVGSPSDFWLHDLREALAGCLGIPVAVARMPFELGPADRTGLQQFAAAMRRRLEDAIKKDPEFARYLLSHRSSIERVRASDDEVLRIMRLAINEAGGKEEVAKFNRRVEEARKDRMQWDAGKLLPQLRSALAPAAGAQRRFLVLTDVDLFQAGANFVFAVASNEQATGLMSVLRFTAAFNDEPPQRERLNARLLKQALSSTGFALGVARCTDPLCARSYPSSLAEHDAKSARLCAACRAGFERALGRSLPVP